MVDGPRVTIGVPTRNRPASLGRLLAALHAQTYRAWDLVIVNDGPEDGFVDELGQFWLDAIVNDGHGFELIPGARINQTYAHNTVLWREDENELVLRIDDDIFPHQDFLEILVQSWTDLESDGHRVGALGGVYFTEHVHPRDGNPPIPTSQHHFTEVLKDGSVSPIAQMQEYTDSEMISAQHLYSSYLYNKDAMRQVGGFPSVYSPGVSYHEETEASYKLFLAGWELFIVPDARAEHSHAEGGTRLLSGPEHKRRREEDWKLFLGRVPQVRGINWSPRVCVYSDHWSGLGGGQRLSYGLVDALTRIGISDLYLLGPAHETVQSKDEVLKNFGIDLGNSQIAVYTQDNRDDWERDIFDVVVSIGHHPPDPELIPPRRKHIHYCLYPRFQGEMPRFVDRYVAISEYSAEAIRRLWRRNPDIVYPYVALDPPEKMSKRKRVLIVGRSAGKGVEKMARFFLEQVHEGVLDDVELRIVVPSEDSDGYIRLKGLGNHELVTLLSDLSQEELEREYSEAAVLWAGRGFDQPNVNPDVTREHFGYTPVEALVNYCVPVCFDDGGYKETTLLRWRTLEELGEITVNLMSDQGYWGEALQSNRVHIGRFARDRFQREWERVLTTTNGLAWDAGIEWRVSDEPDITIEERGVHVACISDHPCDPERQTGYAVFARMLYEGLKGRGWNLHVFAARGDHSDSKGEYASLWQSNSDESFRRFIHHRPFDAALVVYDPYISSDFVRGIHGSGLHIPTVVCATQEGLPPHYRWEGIINYADKVFTFCERGAEEIQRRYAGDREVGFIYPGLDHAPFRKLEDVDRHILRDMLRWEDRFVILSVCRNARNKRVAAMMQVAKLLKHNYGYADTMLLLHTELVPKLERHGCDIRSYIKTLGIEDDDLIYHSGRPHHGGVEYEVDLERLYREGRPRSRTEANRWLRELPMIARYNVADLYLDMSGAEGFGLPLLEALSCGTPSISVNDEYIRRELFGPRRLIPAKLSETWITGAELMLVDPADVSYQIHKFRRGQEALVLRPEELPILEDLRWSVAQEIVADAIEECMR